MTIYIPSKNDLNPFLNEIMAGSQHNFVYGDLNSYKTSYPVVLINWPELLFNWKEPSASELDSLQLKIVEWKKTAKLVYVVHNLKRHLGMTTNFEKLYKIVLTYSDAFIHLGNYSLDLFKLEYPNKIQITISHPLYEKSFKLYDKKEARRILKIPNDKVVFIAPGKIRNVNEKQFILKAFKSLKNKSKYLITPNMLYKKIDIDFRGRSRLKKYIDVRKIVNDLYNINTLSKSKFEYGFSSFERLSLLMSASDIVIIPRLKILNSGNVFLGLTFKKVIVGPNQGNVSEVLKKFSFPIFDTSNQKKINIAFRKALEMHKQYIFDDALLKEFTPKEISKKWDSFFNRLTQRS